MALRKAPPGLAPDEVEACLDAPRPALAWARYRCRLVTPMYGGGVEAGQVDEAMPIRITAIRGQLRFWWRIAHRQRFMPDGRLDHKALYARERALWGGLGDARSLAASKVVLRLASPVKAAVFAPAAKYARKNDGTYKSMPDWEPWAVAYALFPAQGKANRSGVQTPPPKLLKPGAEWTLDVNLHELDETDRGEVETALRWWASFGGVGARTRRGLGAVAVERLGPDGGWAPLPSISQQEAKEAGLTLVFRDKPLDDPIEAWKTAIAALRNFRQKEGIGRNRGQQPDRPGRSRWPEADAIRRHTGTHAPQHAPEHPAGQRFPRAVFGLPIIFHFKDKDDPPDATLTPIDKERMASPLILRPYRQADGRWRAAALWLPHGHVARMALRLQVAGAAPLDLPKGQWWPLQGDEAGRRSAAAAVYPIKLTDGPTEPLTAFLKFFQKTELAGEGKA